MDEESLRTGGRKNLKRKKTTKNDEKLKGDVMVELEEGGGEEGLENTKAKMKSKSTRRAS